MTRVFQICAAGIGFVKSLMSTLTAMQQYRDLISSTSIRYEAAINVHLLLPLLEAFGSPRATRDVEAV